MEKYSGKILPGKPYPLGANWDGKGVNFALYSEHAAAVKLCFFKSENDQEEYTTISLTEITGYVWHAYLPGVLPGQNVQGSEEIEGQYHGCQAVESVETGNREHNEGGNLDCG